MSWRQDDDESDEERFAIEREEREAKLQEARERMAEEQRLIEEERKEIRAKMSVLSDMKTALDRYSRTMRWKTETYSRPLDYSDEKYDEQLEIVAWEIQGISEHMRETLPELFWPKGTPTRTGGGVYVRSDLLGALRLDLLATAESIEETLANPVEEDDDEEDDDDE